MKYYIGQQVFIDADICGGFVSPDWETVTGVEVRYDEMTGKPYQLVQFGSRQEHQFRSDTGAAVKGATAYHLTQQVRDTPKSLAARIADRLMTDCAERPGLKRAWQGLHPSEVRNFIGPEWVELIETELAQFIRDIIKSSAS